MVEIDDCDCWSDSFGPIRFGCQLETESLEVCGLSSRILHQVHGAEIIGDDRYVGKGQEADGLVTDRADVALVIRTADCVPVHVHDGKRIALVHAGWRGTAAGIVTRLADYFDMSKAHTYIGPAISAARYEVDSDLYMDWLARDPSLAPFLQEHKPGSSKRLLDLRGFIRNQLLEMGTAEDRITQVPLCTYESKLPSYRRQGQKAKRIQNFIYRVCP